jgi:hypothetical protein
VKHRHCTQNAQNRDSEFNRLFSTVDQNRIPRTAASGTLSKNMDRQIIKACECRVSNQVKDHNFSVIADVLVTQCPGSAADNVKVLVSSKEEQLK